MKHYDRVTKEYVTEEELERRMSARKPKTRKNCRGGKPHDYVLVIQDYWNHHKIYTTEQVDMYYLLEDDKLRCDNVHHDKLVKYGLPASRSIRFHCGESEQITRHYKCGVCGKKETDI